MKRRDFITLVGGAAAWPVAAHAQQAQIKRIGVLLIGSEGDTATQANLQAFQQTLQALGWTPGRNLLFDFRWAHGDHELLQTYAKELAASKPDLLLTQSVQSVAALQEQTRTIPIVFASASDPVEAGLVSSLSHPGGNITGFTSIVASTNAKWLELLKEVSPQISRVAVLISSHDPSNQRRFRAIQAAGPALHVAIKSVEVTTVASIETALEGLGRKADGGLIVVPNPVNDTLRGAILNSAARYRIPGVYPFRYYAQEGGLLVYGQEQVAQFRSAAGYVDRILRGANPADLPVQAPNEFKLIINLRTARALGLIVPPTLLALADEVIE
jgi:putative tryptophan/tyrosine transport system substrate-binding protein